MKVPTYLDVLSEARKWRISNTSEAMAQAINDLDTGMKKYPDALPLGEEYVLLLKETGKLDEAIAELRKLEQRFKQIGEETLCRWGSLLRLRAGNALASGGLGAAETDLLAAEARYARAYEEFGTHYPRINQLTTRFVRAGLARRMQQFARSANLLRAVETDAAAMLVDPRIWSKLKPHDNVWAAASRGEACALLRQWDHAEAAYSEALRTAGTDAFPPSAMARQIREWLIPTFGWLGGAVEGKLANPDAFFKLPIDCSGAQN